VRLTHRRHHLALDQRGERDVGDHPVAADPVQTAAERKHRPAPVW
jgi:hypothetical protein